MNISRWKWSGVGVIGAVVVAMAVGFLLDGGPSSILLGDRPAGGVHDTGRSNMEPLYTVDAGTRGATFEIGPSHHESNVSLRTRDVERGHVYALWFMPSHEDAWCMVQESRPTYINVEPRVGSIDVHFNSFPPYNGTWEVRDDTGDVHATLTFVLVDGDGDRIGGREVEHGMDEWNCGEENGGEESNE